MLAAAFVWSLPRERERLETVRSASITRRGLEASLRELVQSPAGRAALHACPRLYVPDGRTAALVAYWLDEAPVVPIGATAPPAGGVFLGAAPGDLRPYVTEPRIITGPRPVLPEQYKPVVRTDDWALYKGC